MANPFFSALGGGNNPMTMLAQFRSNPLGMLRQAGYNVPDGINNPQQIIQHLMNSGQINQQQLSNAQAMAQRFGIR